LSRLGPKVVFAAVLGFLVLLSANSIAQAEVTPRFSVTSVAFSQLTWGAQDNFLGLWFEPLWNHGDSNTKPPGRKLPPVHVPEGGSTAMYLTLAGLACIAAIARKKRQASE
jgi:hypothetical protein